MYSLSSASSCQSGRKRSILRLRALKSTAEGAAVMNGGGVQ